ncbi:integumentary mucin C.1-like [Sparus aurata]|uniref:integumentary mucin C.1-like n=1 Tax=Sparus aurata TaxID=8175 RepID=UPI0011C196A7|nr:integumentary mucin C.1-like [Sparus aurata]
MTTAIAQTTKITAPTTTTTAPTTTTTAPTTTTTAPKTTTTAQRTIAIAQTTTAIAPTTTTTAPTMTTIARTTTTAPTTTTTAPATTTAASTTTSTAPTTTTTAPMTTTTAPTTTTTPDPVTYIISARLLNEVFTDDLLSTSSPRFIELSQRVTARCNQIYRARFGSDFDRCIVRQFRAAQAQQTRVVGTEVELSVVFNQSIPASALPLNTAVAQTLVDAANDSNAFNVTFGASSVLLISGPVPGTTTATPETAVTTTAATTSSTPATAAATTAATTTAAPETAVTTTAATTNSNMSFRSVNPCIYLMLLFLVHIMLI